MSIKKSTPKKTIVAAKKDSAVAGRRVSKSALKSDKPLVAHKSVAAKRKPSAGFVRVIMNPVAKPKHFSISAIRNAVRLVASSK